MPETKMLYADTAYANTTALKNKILQAAQITGLRPELIFGALAEENHDYLYGLNGKNVLNILGDVYVLNATHGLPQETLVSLYNQAVTQRKLDVHTSLDKVNPFVNDIGPFNIQLGTAYREVLDYAARTPAGQDPLNLRQYANNIPKLINDLMSGEAAPAIASQVLLKDKAYFDNYADPAYWSARTDAFKDGVYLTGYNRGLVSIDKGRPLTSAWKPQPGEGESAGENQIFNATKIGTVFGNPNYGGTDTPLVPQSSKNSSWTPSTLPLDYADSHTVEVKKGDTLWKIAKDQRETYGNLISEKDLMVINGLAPGQEFGLQIGQRILVPQKINGNLVVDYGNVRLTMNPTDGTYQFFINDPNTNTTARITRSLDSTQTSGYSDRYVKTDNTTGLELESFVNGVDQCYGNQFNNGQPTTNLFTTTITDPTTIGSTGALDPLQPVSANTSTLIKTGTSEIKGIGNVNTASGNIAYANDIIANLFRPGEQNLTTEILSSTLARNFLANPDLINSPIWNPEAKAAALNLLATGVLNAIPTDPLVLDLNGDGVKLTSFADAPVLFDIDHDDGSKEVTGWVSAQDGIVVMDINGNGKIDDISETMSEYFNGAAGTNGNAGTKPYANGFAALKSLDDNNDNAFTPADTAWSNVKVWADANHDGKTDAGELKTFTELGITSINLTPATQSGLVNGGNEILASGTGSDGMISGRAYHSIKRKSTRTKFWILSNVALELALVYGSASAQEPKVNEMQCGDATMRVESYCRLDSKENLPVCSKQVLTFENAKSHKKKTHIFQDDQTLITPISEWSCESGKNSKFVFLSYCMAGNCEIAMDQRFELWATNGNLIVPRGKNLYGATQKFDIKFQYRFKKIPLQ